MQAPSPDNQARLPTALIGALTILLAAALLITGLNTFSMWFDEIRMLLPALAWEPLDLSTWVFRPGHPPLYFVLLRGWIVVAGQADYTLRLLSLMTGVVTVAVIIRIGRDLSRGLFVGTAAGLLFAAMGMVRYYVHETHNYALLMLACMVLLFFYIRWWAHPGRRAYMIGSVLATAGVMYTHYYGVYFILALNLFVLIAGWRRVRDIVRWIGFQMLAAVLYIPWLGVIVFLVRKVTVKMGLKKRERGINAPSTKWATIAQMVNTLLSDQLVLFAILGIITVVGVVLLVRSRRGAGRTTLEPVLLLGLLILGSLAIALGANILFRTFTPRRVIYVMPALALLIGYGLSGLPRYPRGLALIAAVGLIFAGGYSSFLVGNWDFRQMVQSVAAQERPNDLVFLQIPEDSLPGLPLTYYAHTLLPRDQALLNLGDAGITTADSQRYFAQQVFAQRVLARDRFWVISSTDPVYGEPSLDWVSLLPGRRFSAVTSDRIGAFRVTLFTAPGETRAPLGPTIDLTRDLGLPVTLGDDQFELDGVRVNTAMASPGATVTILLDWRALSPPDQDYAVFVHLLKDGQLVAQQDGDPQHLDSPLPTLLWPVGVPIYDTRSLVVPADATPGPYALVMGLYSRTSGARLRVTPAGDTIGGLTLETLEVLAP
jgi:Dolichyl-phosphate-mannose-protein mannosyltransferase